VKKLFIGILIGLVIGWSTAFVVPTYADDDDNPRSYKQYLHQMLYYMRKVEAHLEKIEDNTRAVKEKLHA